MHADVRMSSVRQLTCPHVPMRVSYAHIYELHPNAFAYDSGDAAACFAAIECSLCLEGSWIAESECPICLHQFHGGQESYSFSAEVTPRSARIMPRKRFMSPKT